MEDYSKLFKIVESLDKVWGKLPRQEHEIPLKQYDAVNKAVALLIEAGVMWPEDTLEIRRAHGTHYYSDLGVEVQLP